MVMPACYTYIVECSDGSYYTGKTYDIDHRIKQHNGLLPGGAKYTKVRRPVKLVHYEEYTTNTIACYREAEIKRLTRQQKKQLINGSIKL
jgi:putative endonuclease